ncbi:ribonucleotide-diphosphate reductase subunit beta [Heyndrickxia camelliae]|uniref:Ribonucleoside-diphosphate reductase subunit beta n=1 Tax=Heyndrickxia camelliae TaxID=1707093 RepID=A0A2N3LG00_9BACI|nr:ribonucleotide-diphosphate reductase subunit beta [Heyndrickxia camelliae]PKR83551.1 ribonucleotide-diphosphate reductase subunit beta [Heyndrickxia camelliae]
MKKIKKTNLLTPELPNKPKGLIEGETSGILNWNDLQYPQFYEIYRTLLSNFWTPFEINMSDDIKMWHKLNEHETRAFLNIIGLLSILDSVQPKFLSSVKEYLSDPSAQAILSIIEQQEVVHNQSYSYVLSSIEKREVQNRAFEMARTEKLIYERNKLVIDLYEEFRVNPTIETLCNALAGSVVLEGINFYSGFAFFYNLARNQKMVKTSTMLSYINKDELTHAFFVTMLLKLLMQERPEINKDGKFNIFVNDLFSKATELEITWAEFALSEIEDIDMNEMKDYIKYRANKCLNMLGFEAIYYGVSENSMPWIRIFSDENINLGKTDFFENKSRQYSKVTDDNGFDDL